MYKQSKRRLLKWFDDNDDYNKDCTNSKWLKNPDFQRDFELELIWWLYIVDICHVIGRIDIKKKKIKVLIAGTSTLFTEWQNSTSFRRYDH